MQFEKDHLYEPGYQSCKAIWPSMGGQTRKWSFYCSKDLIATTVGMKILAQNDVEGEDKKNQKYLGFISILLFLATAKTKGLC